MYEIIFDEDTEDFLKSLEKSLKERIYNKIMSTAEDPQHFFQRLTGRLDYKLRVGNYRIIADIDQTKNLIKITRIGHRKNIYDNI